MVTTSIIIVSYNSLNETTAPCLESIFQSCSASDYEVVVVDNNSSDGTADWLRELMSRESRLRCVFNKENRGFAGGNNDGLRLASGEFFILLNSDCIVVPGWIQGLVRPLVEDKGIGLAGPVSNSVGNEQRIFTSGATREEILREGLAWGARSRGSRFETEMLAFFCVAMRRDIVEKIGFLDEGFGRGFYEDDDYCARVRGAGYRLVCLEDIFVYHKGSASFSNSGVATRNLMKENLRKLEGKHGRINPLHPRMKQLRVIENYLEQTSGDRLGPDQQYRIANRLKVVESMMPRGLIKRFIFERRLNELRRKLQACGLMLHP